MSFLETLLVTSISAIVGAITAFLLSMWHWNQQENSRKLDSIADILCKLLDEMNLITGKYWLNVEQDAPKRKYLELEIKTKLKSINSLIRQFQSKTRINSNIGERLKMNNTFDELFDLSTGTNFESKEPTYSPEIAQAIISKCDSLKIQIRTLTL